MNGAQKRGARITPKYVQPERALRREEVRQPQCKSTPQGMVWLSLTKAGDVEEVPVTNFPARIKTTKLLDDGIEIKREFEVAAEFMGRRFEFTLSASRFTSMKWPLEHIGPGAFVFPHKQEYARAAIQSFSTAATDERIYTHSGWCNVDGSWLYLHSEGAIGKTGPASGVKVQLPSALSRYRLQAPADADQVVRAVRASLHLVELGPPALSFPLHAATFRAVFGQSDFSIHLVGQTGVFKTELAALEQQHFGSGMNRLHLPAAWSSTANALEVLAFHAKDALLTIDDFVPKGGSADVARYHAAAERIFRGAGNHAGRGRLDSAARLRETKPPRALIISTGEDIPRGHSVQARLLILEVPKDVVNATQLADCQRDAEAGQYVQAMTGFLRWMAGRYDELQATLDRRVKELRGEAADVTGHARTPEIIANLQAAFEAYLQFAEECGAIMTAERVSLGSRCWNALNEAARAQEKHHVAAEPAATFVTLLRAALVSGHAHLAGRSGDEPERWPERYGWRRNHSGYSPRGDRVGWVDDDDIYLEPTAAYRVVQVAGRAMSDVLSVSAQTLKKRLREKGWLASVDGPRETLTIRRSISGCVRDVLHFRRQTLLPTLFDEPNSE